jgi:uncharacterized Fe-S radical SAM superfamily protein PflX
MDNESRRHFPMSCLCLAITGCGSPIFALCQGCGDDKRAMGPVQPEAHSRLQKLAANISTDFEPAYLRLHRSGELKGRGESLRERMRKCDLCPRQCGATRLDGQKGFCGSDAHLPVSSYHPHFGEEVPLVGRGGSGAVFLTNCLLRCVFCINWEISQGGHGTAVSIDDLAAMLLALQAKAATTSTSSPPPTIRLTSCLPSTGQLQRVRHRQSCFKCVRRGSSSRASS